MDSSAVIGSPKCTSTDLLSLRSCAQDTLARGLHEVDMLSSFFTIIQQDPVISQVKLIAEPWDVGDGGYQVGNFPTKWAEWNGRYRDDMRGFWAGRGGKAGALGYRLTGSKRLVREQRAATLLERRVNLITAHDGFTLRDLVSYDHKHNESQLAKTTKTVSDNNISWNCGAEGPTDDLGDSQSCAHASKKICWPR